MKKTLTQKAIIDIKRNYQLYICIALPLIYILIFAYIPMYGAQIAFKNYHAAKGIWGRPWVGLKHFISSFQSFQFQRVVLNIITLSFYSLIAGFPVPIKLQLHMPLAK